MGKKVRWRILLIVLVLVAMIGGYVATGYSHAKKEWLGPETQPLWKRLKKGIKLGLDLRGGIHLVLQVNTGDAVKAERDEAVEQVPPEPGPLPGAHARAGRAAVGILLHHRATPRMRRSSTRSEAVDPDWTAGSAGGKWSFVLKDAAQRATADNAVSQAIETIRNRVDEFGVAEPLIAREGTDRILVQLPGIDDPKRVKDLIKNTAFLELKLVEKGPSTDKAALLADTGGPGPASVGARGGQARVGPSVRRTGTSSRRARSSRAGT